MKVTVTKYLNVRVGKPSVNAPCYQYLAPGSELEIDGQEYVGDVYHDNSVWYRDEANNYYWSGGVIMDLDQEVFKRKLDLDRDSDSDKPEDDHENSNIDIQGIIKYPGAEKWWIRNFGIPQIWEQYNSLGQDVTIAVVDTGYSRNHVLASKSVFGWNYERGNSDFGDSVGHGTKVTSIINAIHKTNLGVAPQVNIYAAKGSQEGPLYFIDALNDISNKDEIEIISISYDYVVLIEELAKFRDRFRKAILRNSHKIIVASVGNYGIKNSLEIFPSEFERVIGVGSVNKANEISSFTNQAPSLDLYAPGESVEVLAINNQTEFVHDSGTSFATPYVAGVLALMLSYVKQNHPKLNIPNTIFTKILMDSSSKHFGSDRPGIIDPVNAFTQLLKHIQNL